MLPIRQESHWVYKTAQITRIGWFVFHLLFLAIFLSSMPFFWLILPLFFAAFLIPQWVGIKIDSFGVKNYPLLELTFSGLFLIVGCYLLGEYSSFLAYPALCAGIYSNPGKERWWLWAGFSLVPFLAVLAVGLNHLGLGVIDGFFFYGIGVAVAKVIEAEKKTQRLLVENRRQNQLLKEYARQIEKVTLLEERNRLARDLHDTVGHTFTSVIMGLDAASFLMKTSSEKAQEQVDILSDVMRKSLGEIRTQIHQISPSEEREEVPSQLKKIADEFALHTKTTIHFEHIDQHDINISSRATITLIRCLQESLTNAIRHGHASEIMITLKADSSRVILLIQDNGIGIREVSYGFGLNGMKERLESLQGRLSIESKENEGTVVTCFLPVNISRFREGVIQDDKSVTSG
ncbi:sensor histidine kinase [Neobacillus sp. 179-C4.2 HS]|uniref:histidine kinase n=1 Tax=Neobacillus driksii TaxID=3035913 RepID=A0ABV4Z226_9BACI|nr:sensor histidine kinase [Neobacillus sp. 179.-C4.2 HS]MDP5196770.1 sensor histidine kinase [Neobacillus sp. 179.-C4.2 HS]